MSDLYEAARRIVEARAVFFDWDGCLVTGGKLLPGARDLLLDVGSRAYILSNDSTHLPQDLQAVLAADGVRIATDRILLAGHQTIGREAAVANGRAVHLIANPRMTAYAATLGLLHSPTDADTVVLLRDTAFNFPKLEAAVNAARRCQRIVLANPDLTHPGLNGTVVPETGALYAALIACRGNVPVTTDVVGKPSTFLFETALALANAEPQDALMIGDNPDTDGVGAKASGIPFLLVGSEGPVTLTALTSMFSRPSIPPLQRTASR